MQHATSARFLTAREAARILGVAPATVRAWCAQSGFGIKPSPRAQWRISAERIEDRRAGALDTATKAVSAGVTDDH